MVTAIIIVIGILAILVVVHAVVMLYEKLPEEESLQREVEVINVFALAFFLLVLAILINFTF